MNNCLLITLIQAASLIFTDLDPHFLVFLIKRSVSRRLGADLSLFLGRLKVLVPAEVTGGVAPH